MNVSVIPIIVILCQIDKLLKSKNQGSDPLDFPIFFYRNHVYLSFYLLEKSILFHVKQFYENYFIVAVLLFVSFSVQIVCVVT